MRYEYVSISLNMFDFELFLFFSIWMWHFIVKACGGRHVVLPVCPAGWTEARPGLRHSARVSDTNSPVTTSHAVQHLGVCCRTRKVWSGRQRRDAGHNRNDKRVSAKLDGCFPQTDICLKSWEVDRRWGGKKECVVALCSLLSRAGKTVILPINPCKSQPAQRVLSHLVYTYWRVFSLVAR